MSTIDHAVAGLDAFAKQVAGFLELAGTQGARVSDIDREGYKVIELGLELEKRLAEVDKHQKVQSDIDAVKRSVEDKTAKLVDVGGALEESEQELLKEIKRAEDLLSDESKQANDIPIEWVLQLARKLSYSTRAPRGWHYKQNRPLPGRFQPPMPTLDALKQSTLYFTPDQIFESQKANFKASLTADDSKEKGDETKEEAIEWEEDDEQEQETKSRNRNASVASMESATKHSDSETGSRLGHGRRASARLSKDQPPKQESARKRSRKGSTFSES